MAPWLLAALSRSGALSLAREQRAKDVQIRAIPNPLAQRVGKYQSGTGVDQP